MTPRCHGMRSSASRQAGTANVAETAIPSRSKDRRSCGRGILSNKAAFTQAGTQTPYGACATTSRTRTLREEWLRHDDHRRNLGEGGRVAAHIFCYFPTKESVLFRGEYGWFQSFTEQYLQQPASLTEVDAVLASLVALAPRLSQRRRFLVLYERAVASSVTLRGGGMITSKKTSRPSPRP